MRGHRSTPRVRSAAIALCVAVNACITSALAAVVPIFLTVNLRASYFQASVFMVVAAIASSVAIHVLGAIGDVPRRRYPIVMTSAACGLAGALSLTLATSYSGFLLVFASLLAVANSLFPQLMALAFVHDRASTPIVRAVASGGWVVGPPLGALIVTVGSPIALFFAIAAAYAILWVALGAMAFLSSNVLDSSKTNNSGNVTPTNVPQGSLVSVISVLATVHFLIAICALGVPWRITQIGGTEYDVGAAFSIAAAVEIPMNACASYIRRRVGHAKMILTASLMLTLYFLAASLARGPMEIICVSFFNGMATGMMMGLSLIVLQERMPDRPGYASSLYSNMLRLSYVGALLAAGGIAQGMSVAAIFWMAAAMALCLSVGLIVWQPLGPIKSRFKVSTKQSETMSNRHEYL